MRGSDFFSSRFPFVPFLFTKEIGTSHIPDPIIQYYRFSMTKVVSNKAADMALRTSTVCILIHSYQTITIHHVITMCKKTCPSRHELNSSIDYVKAEFCNARNLARDDIAAPDWPHAGWGAREDEVALHSKHGKNKRQQQVSLSYFAC